MLCVNFCGVEDAMLDFEQYSKGSGASILVELSMNSFDNSVPVRFTSSVAFVWSGVVSVRMTSTRVEFADWKSELLYPHSPTSLSFPH